MSLPISSLLKMKTLAFPALIALLLLAGCAATETKEVTTEILVLTAEGPLYDGSNTATYSWQPDLAALLGEGYTAADIKSARITAVQFGAEDEAAQGLVSDVTFQLAGSGVAMQKVAFMNPMPSGQNLVALQVAEDQKGLGDFFKLDEITLVADVNLTGEWEDNLALGVQISIQFELKSK